MRIRKQTVHVVITLAFRLLSNIRKCFFIPCQTHYHKSGERHVHPPGPNTPTKTSDCHFQANNASSPTRDGPRVRGAHGHMTLHSRGGGTSCRTPQ